jgi:hypothetical protein
MKGDFSRDTFHRRHRFSRVLMQQGRVLLDADWNEQTSILLHTIRTLAADLIGPHGGPGDGFMIGCTDEDGEELHCDFTIGRGHYYVDGILCENDASARCGADGGTPPLMYTKQQDYPDPAPLEHGTRYLVYLDVWERHVTHVEVDVLREVALGGPDTASRARIVWQVRVADESECGDHEQDATCAELLAAWIEDRPRCLRARARVPVDDDDPCIIPPTARYRGAENQLYRVEIHDEGRGSGAGGAKHRATFKWSRDNGSVVSRIRRLQGETATLDSLGPDERRGFKEGDWVEVLDDRTVLRGAPGILARVDAVDRVEFEVTLAAAGDEPLPEFDEDTATHPLLRRWDHGSDAIPVQEGRWIDLEDGVQIYFEPDGQYRSGDYWLIPARTAIGDVLWEYETDDDGDRWPEALPPHGIEHHYAPLGRISLDADGGIVCDEVQDCRCGFPQLCPPAPVADENEFQPAPDRDTRPGREDVSRRDEERLAELRRIADVGDVRARRLLESGRDRPAAVAAMSVAEIQSLLDVREEVAQNILESARRLVGQNR